LAKYLAWDIEDLYQSQTPMPSKVLSLLRYDEEFLSEDSAKVFNYVGRYVKCADAKKCQAFLKFELEDRYGQLRLQY
jgi:hypothetical protein